MHRRSILQTEQEWQYQYLTTDELHVHKGTAYLLIQLKFGITTHHFYSKSVRNEHLPNPFVAPFNEPDSEQQNHSQNKGYLTHPNDNPEPRRIDIPGEQNEGKPSHGASFSSDHWKRSGH